MSKFIFFFIIVEGEFNQVFAENRNLAKDKLNQSGGLKWLNISAK